MSGPAKFDARRAFRDRDGRWLIAIGGALAIAAVLLTVLATLDIDRNEQSLATLEMRVDSLRALARTTTGDTTALARLAGAEAGVASAQYHLAAAREQRHDLWTLTGASTLLAALGGLLVGAGYATIRRARLARGHPTE